MKKIIVLIAFLLSGVLVYSQTVLPIDSIRQNDPNGVVLTNGQVVRVTGYVTSSNQTGASGPGSIQDLTGGLAIYGPSFVNNVQIGDSVTVTAVMSNYNGLAELNFASTPAGVLVKHSSGHQIMPKVVTISQIVNQQWNGFEEFESLLIRINNVTISGTGNFVAGNYNITDTTGTLSAGFRVTASVSSIIGTAIPNNKVDIIGVLGQYKVGAPYNSGYQLLPRFIQDIVSDGSPLILNNVNAANIDTNSFTVYYSTARNGNSCVKYGRTSALEMDSVVINNDTTFHKVKVSNLLPGTLYYFKAVSTNSSGRSESGIFSVTTAVTDTTTGKINVYFNFSVDTTVCIPGYAAKGNVDFRSKLVSRINSAQYSIDLALYSFFGMDEIANALIIAKNRGVKVRVVYDSRATQNSMQLLINAGILISKRPTNLSGIMHNKFFVFDARDNILTNDWVWTGSWNVTSTELNWKNNVLEINDKALALAYQTEFEEMWGSTTETPNPTLAKFGPYKSNNTPHSFSIKGRDVKLYFSPSDGTTNQIINAVNTSSKQIYLALYAFTKNEIATAIHNRFVAGVTDIKGVMDDVTGAGSEFTYLSTFADMHANAGGTLHSKYAIVDASYPYSDPTVITGSHNWSAAAESDNDENTLIINDIYIANMYMQDFKKRYNENGGIGAFIVPVINGIKGDPVTGNLNFKLFQNYPNPFNPVTTIRFEIPSAQHIELSIFDILGREVKTLFNGTAPAGIMAVDFNANGLSSGIYIYKIKADGFTASRKLMLMK